MTMSEFESSLCSSKSNIDVSIPFFPKGIRADASNLLRRPVFTWVNSCEVLGHLSGRWVMMSWVVTSGNNFPQSGLPILAVYIHWIYHIPGVPLT